MTYQRTQARALCTKVEYQLFEASLGDQLKALAPARLQGKIRRARDLRNKYRDLLKRQRLANRTRTGSKKGNWLDSNARTAQKAELFGEVLERFEQRAAQQARALKRPAVKTKARAKAKAGTGPSAPAKPRAKKSGKPAVATAFVSEAARNADRRKLSRDKRSKTLHAHARAAGRRVEARRDSRG